MGTNKHRPGILLEVPISGEHWSRIASLRPLGSDMTEREWGVVLLMRLSEQGAAQAAAVASEPPKTITQGAARLRLLRRAMGLTQAQLGQVLGVSSGMVSAMENGRSTSAHTTEMWRHEAERRVGVARTAGIWGPVS